MDKGLIERLALEAGIHPDDPEQSTPATLERFAALVAEECAKVCEREAEEMHDANLRFDECARAIRAKFKTD